MAESICKMVKLYGNVNHTNQNFPFNDCHGKAVLWWEECVMVDSYVESAKCIMGGSGVRVDKKGEDSILISKTPMVITSNNDITVCQSRNALMTVHQAPIRARCMKYTFNNWLTSNWGLITPADMYQFISWGELQAPMTIESWLAFNSIQPENGIPYNQKRLEPCADCSQVAPRNSSFVCETCGAWKCAELPASEWEGGTESELYQALGTGKIWRLGI